MTWPNKKVISLKNWKDRFSGLNEYSDIKMFYHEFKRYYLDHKQKLTNGELYAFDRFGREVRSQIKDEDL